MQWKDIPSWKKGGQWKSALLLRKMREAGMTANVTSFNAAMSGCEKGVQKEQSFALLYKMHEAGMTAKVISFSAVI